MLALFDEQEVHDMQIRSSVKEATAKRLVGMIESVAKSDNITIEEACRKAEIDLMEYRNCKEFLQTEETYS